MAQDALVRGLTDGEALGNGVTRLVLRNHGIDVFNEPAIRLWGSGAQMAEFGIGAAVNARAIVGINNVATGAAAGAVIARLVVGAEEIERRIQEPSFLQADEHGIGAVFRAQA